MRVKKKPFDLSIEDIVGNVTVKTVFETVNHEKEIDYPHTSNIICTHVVFAASNVDIDPISVTVRLKTTPHCHFNFDFPEIVSICFDNIDELNVYRAESASVEKLVSTLDTEYLDCASLLTQALNYTLSHLRYLSNYEFQSIDSPYTFENVILDIYYPSYQY